jgi:Glycosyl hydrolases family 43
MTAPKPVPSIPSVESDDPRRRGRRRRRVALGLSGLAVLVMAMVTYDTVTITTDHRTQASLKATAATLSRTRSTLATTVTRIASTNAARNTRAEAAARTSTEISSVLARINTSAQATYFQDLDIGTLQTCLTGVSTAVTAIGQHNLPGADSSITAASSACTSLNGSDLGLAYPFDFPDPFILPQGHNYFAFGTNSAAGNIQILQSSDLKNWTTVGDALPKLASWAQPGATWAPSVLQRGNTFVLYYSAIFGSTGEQCISEAVATQPQGPYLDTSEWPLVCQLGLGGSIDPSPYVGTDGQPYLVWKSQGINGQPAALWSQQLKPNGQALAGNPSSLLTPDQSWQNGIVEGPDMVVAGGSYLLFYSGSDWHTAGYAIGVADCTGPMGPCTDTSPQPLLASGPSFSGPGGPSVFADTQGNLWMAFHAWLPGRVGYPNSRPLFLLRITVTGGAVQIGL